MYELTSVWIDDIKSGKKKWDARPMVPWLNDIRTGDEITIRNGQDSVVVKVEAIRYFRDFGEAWFILDENLVSGITTRDEAVKFYNKYFEQSFVDKYGIIAFKLIL